MAKGCHHGPVNPPLAAAGAHEGPRQDPHGVQQVVQGDRLHQGGPAAQARIIGPRRHVDPTALASHQAVTPLDGGSDEATERWVSDSLVLRQCCWVYVVSGPDDTTLLRWATLIQPATLHHLLNPVGILARSLTGTSGRKLRIDGTVVTTPSHHPTASTWL
jgi:hypothetical protein